MPEDAIRGVSSREGVDPPLVAMVACAPGAQLAHAAGRLHEFAAAIPGRGPGGVKHLLSSCDNRYRAPWLKGILSPPGDD
jgi:hypothetical protein